MQADGNLVIYGPAGPVWATGTNGPDRSLVVQSDGNLVIYGPSGPVWDRAHGRIGGAAVSALNAAIADVAERSPDGSYGGWCKVFANNVVSQASGGRLRPSGYQEGWARLGKEVGAAEASRGDIIQVTPAGSDDQTAEALAGKLHTAIILRNEGNGSFAVIDSNYVKSMAVFRHSWNPYTWAPGANVKIWRLA